MPKPRRPACRGNDVKVLQLSYFASCLKAICYSFPNSCRFKTEGSPILWDHVLLQYGVPGPQESPTMVMPPQCKTENRTEPKKLAGEPPNSFFISCHANKSLEKWFRKACELSRFIT
ncbi:hypothetical protein NPIL_146211 [Nephila pilipes]|uniref:Uncharacterized protein n=1 Tax=Nephila pilipes TaxID=299642 RepID=A0A8X6UCV6_NEPPI|nr:hypothetical protein NPIL_146211 [Nephila pilipes]